MALANDYEEILAAIQHELFSHSHMKDVSKSAPCKEITDKNATMIKSIGRTTKSVIDIDSEQKFEIAYCSSEGADSTCAVDSTCATIYRWKRANIRQELYPSSGLEMMSNDEILVPQGCTCVINSIQSGQKSNLPIIIF
uniref:Protein spaetzle n=1 Tax=Ditylenchus dipsaci TaxID=166011 RepID=A0A915DHV8_9BILA